MCGVSILYVSVFLLQGEGSSEDWLEYVSCFFSSAGMKEVRDGDPPVGPLLAEGCHPCGSQVFLQVQGWSEVSCILQP